MSDIKITELPVTSSVSDNDELIVQQSDGTKRTALSNLPAGVPDGGTTGQVLTKESNTDGDANWETASYMFVDELGAYSSATPINADLLNGHSDNYFQKALSSGEGIIIANNVISSKLIVDLLWTNSSPTSSFASQTINLDLSSYEFVFIVFKLGATLNGYEHHLLKPLNLGGARISSIRSATQAYFRITTVNTTNIGFNSGQIATFGSSTAEDNTVMIPYQIYGIK